MKKCNHQHFNRKHLIKHKQSHVWNQLKTGTIGSKKSVFVSDWEQGKIVQSWNERIFDALLHIL